MFGPSSRTNTLKPASVSFSAQTPPAAPEPMMQKSGVSVRFSATLRPSTIVPAMAHLELCETEHLNTTHGEWGNTCIKCHPRQWVDTSIATYKTEHPTSAIPPTPVGGSFNCYLALRR